MISFLFLVVLLSSSILSQHIDFLFVPGQDFLFDGAICRFENFFHRYDKKCPWGWNVTRDRNAKIAQDQLEYWHPSNSWAQYPVFHPFCCRPLFPFENYTHVRCKWSGSSFLCRGRCENGWMDMTVAGVVDSPKYNWQKEFGKTCANGVNNNAPKYLKASSYLLHIENYFKTCSEQCTNKPVNISNRDADDTKAYERCVNTVCASVIPSGTWKHRLENIHPGYFNIEHLLWSRRKCIQNLGCDYHRLWGDKEMHICMEYVLAMEDTLAARGVDRHWDRHNSSCGWSKFCPPVNKCECGEIDNSPSIGHDVSPRERNNDEVGDGMINFFKQCSQRCDSMEGVLNKKDCVNHLCSFVIPDRMENEPERYNTEIYMTGNHGIDIYRLLDVPRRCREEFENSGFRVADK